MSTRTIDLDELLTRLENRAKAWHNMAQECRYPADQNHAPNLVKADLLEARAAEALSIARDYQEQPVTVVRR